MGSEEDEPLRLYGLDEVCRGILVAIDKVIIFVFGVIVNRFFTSVRYGAPFLTDGAPRAGY